MPPAPRSPPPHRSRGPAPAHLIINPPPREERDSCAEEKKHSCVFEHLKGDDDVVVVSSAYGSQGDVGPLVALARALQRRRVASVVAFVGNGFFRADVENPRTPELRFVEVGTKRGYEDLLVNSHKRKDKRALVRYWLSHLEEHYAALRELLRGRRRVVVVAHPLVRRELRPLRPTVTGLVALPFRMASRTCDDDTYHRRAAAPQSPKRRGMDSRDLGRLWSRRWTRPERMPRRRRRRRRRHLLSRRRALPVCGVPRDPQRRTERSDVARHPPRLRPTPRPFSRNPHVNPAPSSSAHSSAPPFVFASRRT